ncbi:MAG: carboxylating nicotinate-nucleotide diphosphorylase [Actinobacteria bacterium]|jgi:nicotinate-nucleotide pyrophosphorylase (carboxylating)|nr:carboxylating nicotinate-nucleotide diphosphorylase [Actinomycetota bacterium]
MSLSSNVVAALEAAGLDPAAVESLVRSTVAEDLDGGVDVTSAATVPAEQRSVLDLVARGTGVAAGVPVAAAVFDAVSEGDAEIQVVTADGTRVSRGDVLLTARGRTRDLLTAERTALNLLCHLSGVATATRQWADALEGTAARVRDTRKTTPGLRVLEKYAVRCGGGVNHRMSLSDAALVKDNHVVAAGGVAAAFDKVRAMFPGLPVEVEVDSLQQLTEVLDAGADLVLLDNFVPDQMRLAVGIAEEHAAAHGGKRALLEASGGLTLPDAAAVGATGVDYIAVGALTHSAPVLDVGADLRPLDA